MELPRPLGAEPAPATYGSLHAARAAFLAELGRVEEAVAAYEDALRLTDNAVERTHLRGKLAALSG
ncbi:hypothetical protein [Nocardia caishijiensis]|uniref:Tetratricopeptide repeat protein n=1 Tax=Nocardia caishijiensis TaxID=184756 RepID=A0ABQ6YP80_9NOCA|nr:hypothetical protein [Nocardia caishijiensis]KAF0847473.1 hypothetical protein FNL39_103371 [Nocardia caishijiensis]